MTARLAAVSRVPIGTAALPAASVLIVTFSLGALLSHGDAALIFGAVLVVPVGGLVLRQPHYGVLAGVAVTLLAPYWYTFGIRQASIERIGALLALGTVVVAARRWRARRLSLVDVIVLAYVVAAFASWATSGPATKSTFQLALNALTPLMFYAAARRADGPTATRVLWTLLLAGAGAATTLFYELFVTHRALFISRDEYLWNSLHSAIFRPAGVLGSPTAAAAVLAMTSLAGLPLLSRSRGRSRALALACITISVAALIATVTRAGLIAFLAGGICYLGVSRTVPLARLLFVAAAAAVVFLLVVLPDIESTAWYQRGVLRSGTLAARETYWKNTLPLITNSTQHIAFGHGVNSLSVGRPQNPGTPDADLASEPLLLMIGPHNQYVRTLFEQGLIGILLLVGWLVGSVTAAIHAMKRETHVARRLVLAGSAAGVVAFMVASAAGDTLRHPPTFAIVALLTGLVTSRAAPRGGEAGLQETE